MAEVHDLCTTADMLVQPTLEHRPILQQVSERLRSGCKMASIGSPLLYPLYAATCNGQFLSFTHYTHEYTHRPAYNSLTDKNRMQDKLLYIKQPPPQDQAPVTDFLQLMTTPTAEACFNVVGFRHPCSDPHRVTDNTDISSCYYYYYLYNYYYY